MDVDSIIQAIVPYTPNLIFITLTLITSAILLRYLSSIISGVHRQFNIPRSYYFTLRGIFRLIIYALTVVFILIFTPGVNEQIVALVGIGIGVVVSLSSTTTIGNAVAGLIIYVTRPIREGDRIMINDVYGDVVNIELLFIHVKTIKNEIVSLPALSVLGNQIINYSQLDNVIIHFDVSLGYDIGPIYVEQLLVDAAKKVDGVMDDPEPFVLIKELANHYIVYEVNAHIDHPQDMVNVKSKLMKEVLLHFAHNKVQILSPFYVNTQESPEPKVIPDRLLDEKDVSVPDGMKGGKEVSESKKEEAREESKKEVAEAKAQLEEKKKQDIKLKEDNN